MLFDVRDIASSSVPDLNSLADLAWASFFRSGFAQEFMLRDLYQEIFGRIGVASVPQVWQFLADRIHEPLTAHTCSFAAWRVKMKICS